MYIIRTGTRNGNFRGIDGCRAGRPCPEKAAGLSGSLEEFGSFRTGPTTLPRPPMYGENPFFMVLAQNPVLEMKIN